MANRAHIQYQGDPETLKKQFLPEVKATLQEMVDQWHNETLPGHFTPAAVARYGYRKRTKKYMIQKAKKRGNQNPLMWTGDLRRQAMRRAKITGTSKSATATMTTPWYTTKRFKGNATYADEMTAVALPEAQQMAIEMQHKLVERLETVKKQAPMKKRG
jgi:hypothetical protein